MVRNKEEQIAWGAFLFKEFVKWEPLTPYVCLVFLMISAQLLSAESVKPVNLVFSGGGDECERVGGSQVLKTDVRVLAATNRDLEQMIKDGAFLRDLYDRLNVVSLTVPPLRERLEDIPAHPLGPRCFRTISLSNVSPVLPRAASTCSICTVGLAH